MVARVVSKSKNKYHHHYCSVRVVVVVVFVARVRRDGYCVEYRQSLTSERVWQPGVWSHVTFLLGCLSKQTSFNKLCGRSGLPNPESDSECCCYYGESKRKANEGESELKRVDLNSTCFSINIVIFRVENVSHV